MVVNFLPLPPKAKAGDFPHLLFYGPTGAGKKTRIMALLRELFDSGVEKVLCSPTTVPVRDLIPLNTVLR